MDSLQIKTGEKRIAINDDPNRVIVFNPSDVTFAEKFYLLIGEFQQKLTEYKAKSEELDADQTADENGLPINMNTRLELIKESCKYIKEKIDSLFGPDTSQKAFGDALQLDMFIQFFEGITPFIQAARSDKLQKYSNKKAKRVLK